MLIRGIELDSILYFLAFDAVVLILVGFIFDILLRGFSPFIRSRPWVVDQILEILSLPIGTKRVVGISSGRSGVMHEFRKYYPDVEVDAYEYRFFPYLVSLVQSKLRRSGIRIHYAKVRHVDVKKAGFIYVHLNPDQMRSLGQKLRFECSPGTIVISTGFNIPYLNAYKVLPLKDRKNRFDWLSKNLELFSRKSRKFKKEPKAYFYEI